MPKYRLIFKSIELRSFDNLVKMLVGDTRSKKSVRDEKRRLLIIDPWILLLILGLDIAMRRAGTKANNPKRKPIRR